MFNRIAALALAAFATLVLLGGVDTIADHQARAATAESTPVQQIVIVGQRLPRA